MRQIAYIIDTRHKLPRQFPLDLETNVLRHRWTVLLPIDVLRARPILLRWIEVGQRRVNTGESIIPVKGRQQP